MSRGLSGEMHARASEDDQAAGRRTSVPLLVAVLVLFPLLAIIAYVATRTVLPNSPILQLAISQASSSAGIEVQSSTSSMGIQQTTTGAVVPPLTPQTVANGPLVLNFPAVNFVGVLLIVAAVVAVVVIWRGSRARGGRTAPFDGIGVPGQEQAARAEAGAIVGDAARKLRAGEPYKETVIRCYRALSELLEKRYGINGTALTAREFEARIFEKLKVTSSEMARMTELFEVARYSDREVTASQSTEAASHLSRLSALFGEAEDNPVEGAKGLSSGDVK